MIDTAELKRAAGVNDFGKVEQEWNKLMEADECHPAAIQSFMDSVEVLAKQEENDRLETMLWSGIEEVRESRGTLAAIELAGPALVRLPKSTVLRDQAIELVRVEHGDTPGFDVLLEEAGIAGGRPARRAVRTLGVCLTLKEGDFLAERRGNDAVQVVEIDPSTWEVSIQGRDSHETLTATELADRFEAVDIDDIRVLGKFKPERFTDLLQREPETIVIGLLKMAGGKLDSEQIKDRLCPAHMDENEWRKWWTKARQRLKTCPHVTLEGRAPYLLTFDEAGRTVEHDAQVAFERARGDVERWTVVQDYLRDCRLGKRDVDESLLLKFQTNLLQSARRLLKRNSPSAWQSLLFAEGIAPSEVGKEARQSALGWLKEAEDPVRALRALEVDALWPTACDLLVEARPHDARKVFSDLLPQAPFGVCNLLAERLVLFGMDRQGFEELSQRILSEPELYSDALFWLWDGPSVPEAEPADRAAILVRIMRMISDLQRLDHVGPEMLKRIKARSRTALAARDFERFRQVLDEKDSGIAITLKSALSRTEVLGRAVKEDALRILVDYLPKEPPKQETPPWFRDDILWVTRPGKAKREAELSELINVKMRENAKAIGEAASHGDLSENSEYKFALEERDLLRARAAQMQDELSKAKVLRPEDVLPDRICPGCSVDLGIPGKDETYELTFVGPWEADIERQVYNYKSPLGQALMGKAVGDQFELNVGQLVGRFEVRAVRSAVS